MKIALIALAGLLPALASADDAKPYVVFQGRQVRGAPAATPAAAPAAAAAEGGSGASANTSTARQVSNFGTSAFQPGISRPSSSGRAAPAARAFRGVGRSSHRRGIVGSTPIGTPAPAPTPAATDAPPAYAVPGAKILSEGQQPVYSDPKNGGTHSIEGGGFIAMDQAKAHDVGRAPGITWAPPDTPPSATPKSGAGSGASANGPSNGNTTNITVGNTGGGGNSNSGGGNNSNNGGGGNSNNGNGGSQDNSTGFNPAF